MSAFWLSVAFAAISIFRVYCATDSAVPDGKSDDELKHLASALGLCVDETCKDYRIYGPSDLESIQPTSQAVKVELPRAHCIFLKPSAVNLFTEMEGMHPGVTNIKYKVFEELIEYMHEFGSFELQNCHPEMKLIELVILAANSLKAQYALQGYTECIYKTSEDETSKPVPSDEVTEMPCDPKSSGYVTGTSIVCPGSTKPTEKPYEPTSTQQIDEKPYVSSSTASPTTEKLYEATSTQRITEKPYVPSSTEKSIVAATKKPCPDETTEKPCQPSIAVTEEYSSTEETEIIAEDEAEQMIPQVGSLRGIPGVHYPNYTDIPITSFTCADKEFIPGFYADLDTGCQVFHVCYEHRRESFLCPLGTIFNQPILACDYWYSSNCSLAPNCYDVNEKTNLEVEELLTLIEKPRDNVSVKKELDEIAELFPVKVIVTDTKPKVLVPIEATTPYTEQVASEIVDEMVTTATKVISNTRQVIRNIPEPVVLKPAPDFVPVFKKPMKMTDLLKQAVVPVVKAKLAAIPISKATVLKTAVPVAGFAKAKVAIPVKAAAVPVLVKAKVAAAVPVLVKAKVAAAVPVLAKAKVAAAVPVLAKAKMSAIPAVKAAVAMPSLAKAKISVAAPVIAKGKIAVPAFKVASAKVAAKSSMPALKAKMAVPLAKTKIVPLVKAKVAKSAGMPLLKAKMLALPLAKSKLAGPLPLAKVKLAKAAAISPLTKKALALGYMKLLKAKKIALMG